MGFAKPDTPDLWEARFPIRRFSTSAGTPLAYRSPDAATRRTGGHPERTGRSCPTDSTFPPKAPMRKNKRMEVLANNLANANTTAFKRSTVNFEDLFYRNLKLPALQDATGNYTPTGIAVGLGTRVQSTGTDFTQGNFIETNDQLDVAISGRGFFQVIDPNTGQIVYTRAGNLALNSTNQLVIESAQVGRVLQPAISLPQDYTGIIIGHRRRPARDPSLSEQRLPDIDSWTVKLAPLTDEQVNKSAPACSRSASKEERAPGRARNRLALACPQPKVRFASAWRPKSRFRRWSWWPRSPLGEGMIVRPADVRLQPGQPSEGSSQGLSIAGRSDRQGSRAVRSARGRFSTITSCVRRSWCGAAKSSPSTHAPPASRCGFPPDARDEGAMGDLVTVESLAKRETYFARVTGPQSLRRVCPCHDGRRRHGRPSGERRAVGGAQSGPRSKRR